MCYTLRIHICSSQYNHCFGSRRLHCNTSLCREVQICHRARPCRWEMFQDESPSNLLACKGPPCYPEACQRANDQPFPTISHTMKFFQPNHHRLQLECPVYPKGFPRKCLQIFRHRWSAIDLLGSSACFRFRADHHSTCQRPSFLSLLLELSKCRSCLLYTSDAADE